MVDARDELEKKLQDSNAKPMSLPLEFLKAITSDFSTELLLGDGGFGEVYKGVLRSGKIIAVKKLFEIRLEEEKFQNEVDYLMEIKHQNIVQLIGYCAESSWETIKQPNGKSIWAELPKRLLCFEYASNGSLHRYIFDESSGLKWSIRYNIIRGICSGLHFLHEKCRIVHLDLKPENILMDAARMPKIADFGLSRIFGSQQSRINTKSRTGSLGYVAPEYSFQGIVSMKADIFSLGVIIVGIVTGRRDYPLNMLPYFQLDSPHDTDISFQHYIGKVVECWTSKFVSTLEYKPMEKYTHQVKQCITIALQCVDPVMARRPSADDIIQFFNAIEQMETHEKLPLSEQCTSSQNYQEAVNTSTAPQANGSGRTTEPRESTSNPTSSNKSKKVSNPRQVRNYRGIGPYVFDTKCKVVTSAICQCYSPGEAATIVFEDVYRDAYEMVRHNHGKELYSVVESTMASEVQVLGSALGNFFGTLLLREILAKWRWHMRAVHLINDLLMYMDKTFVAITGMTPIYELGLGLWRDLVVHSEVRPWLIEAVRQERGAADVAVPAGDLMDGVKEMLAKLGDELHHEVMDAPPLEEYSLRPELLVAEMDVSRRIFSSRCIHFCDKYFGTEGVVVN